MPAIRFRKFPIGQSIFWGITLLVAIGLFTFVRSFVICWRVTSLPGIPPASCAGENVNPLGTPIVSDDQSAPGTVSTLPPSIVEEIDYPSWDGASRINILFVGLRGGEPTEADCPLCTDTLILITVDPQTKTAGMLSIPRDMWVNIPGFGYSRINTAWSYGQASNLPGKGPAMTMKTVSQFIGVPVDYYLQVDFDTFIDVIDMLGGVDVDNDETLFLDPVYHNQEYPKVKLTCCGTRHLNGRVALAYARCRHAEQGCKDGDVGRARRQQKVIFGILDKVLSPENFPGLIAQAPQLYSTFSSGIHTNMSLDDALKLAVLARDISRENITNKVIDDTMATLDSVTIDNKEASILRPIPDQIRVLRDEIFTTSRPISPMAQGDLAALMQADGASIRIVNGTATAQLDVRTSNYLTQQGMIVKEIGNTDPTGQTIIILYSPKLYTLRFLLNVFAIANDAQIRIQPDPSQSVDIEVRLGNDWIASIPSGY